ncbi:MAG: hypothetical protein NC131_05190 [Roseburia sp.]|nr:hypothetical protein [Roseburia sp.]
MITKKCAVTIGGFALTMLVCFITMHLLSLASVSKWVGVGTGAGMFALSLVFAVVFRKERLMPYFIIPVNAVGDGLAVSSLFVYLGAFPKIWETAVVFAGLCLLLFIYCLLTNIPFLRNHFVISMLIFVCLILGGLIAGAVICESKFFYLALICLIPFIAFLIATVLKAKDAQEQIKNMSYVSFAALIIIIIAVIAVISQGDGLDGMGDGLIGDVGKTAKPERNPYDFYTTL